MLFRGDREARMVPRIEAVWWSWRAEQRSASGTDRSTYVGVVGMGAAGSRRCAAWIMDFWNDGDH